MRIIGGRKRGAKIIAPTGNAVRPTSDRMREGVFNIMSGAKYRGVIGGDGVVACDVFAGSGAMGLEAWSRFATQIVFIENNPAALESIKTNIARLGVNDKNANAATIIPRDATRRLNWPHNIPPASLLFLDPPWQKDDLAIAAIKNLIALGAVAEGAIISVEHDAKNPPDTAAMPPSCSVIETRRWGRGAAVLLKMK